MKNMVVDGEKCTFEMNGDYSTANAIRRVLVSDVETYAPSEVIIHTNTSCQPDEYIAHRIGLIPFLLKKYTQDIHQLQPPVINLIQRVRSSFHLNLSMEKIQ